MGATKSKSPFSFKGDGIDEAREEYNDTVQRARGDYHDLSKEVGDFSKKIDSLSETRESQRDSAHEEEPDAPEQTETTPVEPAMIQERPGEWEHVQTKDGKNRAFVGNYRDPQDPNAPKLGNWDLNIPGMKVQARSNDYKNDMELIWEQAALPTTSNTPPAPAKIIKSECVVQETDKTSKISCVFPKPDKNLDNIKLGYTHFLSVDIKNEAGGRTRMDVIWDKAASSAPQNANPAPNVAPVVH
ncbi:MAG: hypothetical protein R3F23_00870 [Verrucomicrobiia bacterium]